jgi:hypothetical protein
MNELIYEQWHFPRPKLAQSYLALLRDGSGDPICLQDESLLTNLKTNEEPVTDIRRAKSS